MFVFFRLALSSFCSIFRFFWLIVAISSTNTIFRYTVGSVIPNASNQNKHVRAASAACCSKAGGQQVHCPRLLPALTHDDCRSTSTRHPDESTVGPMVHAYRVTDAPRTDGADIPHRIAKNPLLHKVSGFSQGCNSLSLSLFPGLLVGLSRCFLFSFARSFVGC